MDYGRALESPELYSVGWIAALPLERAAATAMLDERHNTPENFKQDRNDTNSYTWGRVGQHNVVIASLPAGEYGTTVAATTALSMRFSLPHIRIGLLVGIGAGIPRPDEYDIRLGDVVVSQPTGRSGGVVQYDFVKAKSGKLERTGYLNMPPEALRKGLAKLQAEHELQDSNITSYLDEMLVNHPKLNHSKPKKPGYVHQGTQNDRLFKSSYVHASSTSCQACDDKEQMDREPRDTPDPEIHYGVIASGNMLVKDAAERDSILGRMEERCICFEMEAAGLMNNFPCLVIRGICDYADSHKNDQWQKYAAATAAGFAKELLGFVDGGDVENSRQIGELLKNVKTDLSNVRTAIKNLDERIQDDKQIRERAEVLSWLSEANHQDQYEDSLKKHQEGTGEWFLTSHEFISWLSEPNRVLFCPGIPGAGKTILASLATRHLLSTQNTKETLVAFLYCNYGRKDEQTDGELLAALLKQFVQRVPELPSSVSVLQTICVKERRKPTLNELTEALLASASCFKRIFLVIDAADELSDKDRHNLFKSIARWKNVLPISLLVTSRPISSIDSYFECELHLEILAPQDDVEIYIRERLQELGELVQNNAIIQREIMEGIASSVHGMFLLARLYFDSLVDKQTVWEIEDVLNELNGLSKPTNRLNMAYDGAMQRIDNQTENERAWARKVLFWVVHARRPLSTAELQHALAVHTGDRELLEKHCAFSSRIVSLCAGLVTIQRQADSVQLVHYTTQQYFQQNPPSWMSTAQVSITRTCLAYLSLNVFSSGSASTYETYKERIKRHVFLQYAARYWGEHAKFCEHGLERHLRELWDFLRDENLTDSACQAMSVEMGARNVQEPVHRWIGSHFLAFFGLGQLLLRILNNGFLEERTHPFDFDARERLNGQTPLALAAEKGKDAVVDALIKLPAEKVSVDSRDLRKRTPLSYGAENGHFGIVEALVGLGKERVDPASEDLSGRTPLYYAAKNGHNATVELLSLLTSKHAGPYPHPQNSPLCCAAENGHYDIVKSLIRFGPGFVDPGRKNLYNTALSHAARRGHDKIVRLLINLELRSVDVNFKDHAQCTPLYLAAVNGHYDVVKLLIDLDEPIVDVNASTRFGGRPLHSAIRNGHDAVAKLLIELGPERVDFGVNRRTRMPVKEVACLSGKEVFELLFEDGWIEEPGEMLFQQDVLCLPEEKTNDHDADEELEPSDEELESPEERLENQHKEARLKQYFKNASQDLGIGPTSPNVYLGNARGRRSCTQVKLKDSP